MPLIGNTEFLANEEYILFLQWVELDQQFSEEPDDLSLAQRQRRTEAQLKALDITPTYDPEMDLYCFTRKCDRIARAERVLEHLSEEWIQNIFGTEETDVLFDALNLYIEQQQVSQ